MIPGMEPAVVEEFRAMVAGCMGLHFDDGKLGFLAEVARQRIEATGVGSLDAYLRRVASDRVEIRSLAAHLTVGETYFFRYWDHFRAFVEVVLPGCAQRRSDARHLRILSAGCASGEEAHSLAILVLEHLPDAAAWNVEIQGIDVNPAAVEKAKGGRYSAWSLRDTPPDLRDRYFRAEGRDFLLHPKVRALVSFDEQNLADVDSRLWRDDPFDLIFCRNVMMYFTPGAMHGLVARIARVLSPGGHLFLGHAETLRGVSQDFHLCHTHATFYYQRKERGEHESPGSAIAPTALAPSTSTMSRPAALDGNEASWVDAIRRASERVAKLTSDPSPVFGITRTRAREWTRDGSALDLGPAVEMLRQERFTEAMDLLRALPPPSMYDPEAQLLRAVLLTNSGQLDTAREVCAQILAADDLNAGAHYLMALSREHAGDLVGAADEDQIATYLDSRFAMPRLHLGLLARRAGDLERARTELHLAHGLLSTEEPARILLFGGGFGRAALLALCQSELRRCGGGG